MWWLAPRAAVTYALRLTISRGLVSRLSAILRVASRPGFPILGVFRLKGQPKRDGSTIFRSCKASQSPVYPVRDTVLAVNHASCLSLSRSSTTPELPPPSQDPITADLTAHLDHTSDEFKTIIQEHYRRTPSLRKLADIHGVSRSTVHRIVQAQ